MYEAALKKEEEKQEALNKKYLNRPNLFDVKFISPVIDERDAKVVHIQASCERFKLVTVRTYDGIMDDGKPNRKYMNEMIHENVRLYPEKPSQVDHLFSVCWRTEKVKEEKPRDTMTHEKLIDYEEAFYEIRKITGIKSPILTNIQCKECGSKDIKLLHRYDGKKFHIFASNGKVHIEWEVPAPLHVVREIIRKVENINSFAWGSHTAYNFPHHDFNFLDEVEQINCVCGQIARQDEPNKSFMGHADFKNDALMCRQMNMEGIVETRFLSEDEKQAIIIRRVGTVFVLTQYGYSVVINSLTNYGEILDDFCSAHGTDRALLHSKETNMHGVVEAMFNYKRKEGKN